MTLRLPLVLLAAFLTGMVCIAPESIASESTASESIASESIASEDEPTPTAPDGRPGLGVKRTARELSTIFLSPTEEEAALLRGLTELDSDVRVLAEMARRTYVDRGYFTLLDHFTSQGIEALHLAYLDGEQRALDLTAKSSPEAEAWIGMFVDLRFRARLPILEAYRTEAREVQAGLALLRGISDGYIELKDSEARVIAKRVDLASALLRAARLDLEVLRERGDDSSPGQPDPAWMVELIGLTKIRGGEERRVAFKDLQDKIAGAQARLESVLFSPRLRSSLEGELQQRSLSRDKALEYLGQVKLLLHEFPEGFDPPPTLLKMRKTRRHQLALSEALRGIGFDPFNAELAYRAGLCTDQLYGPLESRQWFDRFLALRGIRLHLSGTTEHGLSKEEEYALLIVRRGAVGLGR